MPKTTVGERVAAARTLRGWSQSELARRVEVAPQTINQIESGRRVPSHALLVRLTEALETTLVPAGRLAEFGKPSKIR